MKRVLITGGAGFIGHHVIEHILNETAYQNNIDSSLPIDNTDKTSINYPFVMMKSINNENCLTNNHGSITVQPCYSFVAQRWFPL